MKQIDLHALNLTEEQVKHDVVRFSTSFNRKIRQDPPEQLGLPTQYLAMLAVKRRDFAVAEELTLYMRQESDFIFDSMMTLWLRQLMDHAKKVLGLEKYENIFRVPETHIWASLQRVGNDFVEEAVVYLKAERIEEFDICLSHARRIYKTMGDEVVKFVQDILTEVSLIEGADGPISALKGPYDTIWRKRYLTWESLTGEERLQLSCEGMRAHFGGPTRQGEFKVVDEGKRFRMIFAGCGTGGVLRRGDIETGEGPYLSVGVVKVPEAYSWGQTGMPWYCTHCNLYLEHWPVEDMGVNRRPVIFKDDPNSTVTTEWLVYKDLADTEEEDYTRIWAQPPTRK
ncbi:MAG: hypothetical protein NT152_03545 [Actinobacteria bacterium]|nr:hypothetical protein [Actinomycetota bacterium]